jgi:hypothetical protein
MNNTAVRLVVISASAWALWSFLIFAAKPNPPEGTSKLIFLASMALTLVACVWSCWHLLPQHRSKPWRRSANVLIGTAAFLAILGVGHSIGKFIAQGA